MSFSYLVYWRYSEEKNMKKTNKTRLGTNLKRGMSLGLSIVMTFAVLMANGCDKAETIDDYPEVQVIVDDETDNVDVPEVIEDEEVVVAKETIDRGYDSIYDTGTFVFNPEAVNPAIKEEMKNKETSYKIGIDILNAIHEHKTEFELTGDDEVDELDFNRGFKLARTTSPMATCVDITKVDTNKYKINYFPTVSADGHEIFEGDISMSEVENRLSEFEEYVTNTINNNITADDDYMERAEKIYKVLIEDIELVEDEELLIKSGRSNPMDEVFASYDTAIIDVTENKKLNQFQFIFLYDFFLSELNIKHVYAASVGDIGDVPTDSIKEALELTYGVWYWMIVADEENNFYHCDILMDKMLLDEQRRTQKDYESDMVFFGISDKTRKETLDIRGVSVVLTMDSSNSTHNSASGVSECKEDYKK